MAAGPVLSEQPQVRRRRSPWLWVLAGCATAFVLAAVGVGYGAYSLVHGFLSGTAQCLPSDFPRYPGAVEAAWSFDLNGTYPGNTCHTDFQSNDNVDAITAFYESSLNRGSWRVTSSSTAGQVDFQPATQTQPFGTVSVSAGQAHTDIAIDLFTSTCLPIGFPTYPGLGFGGQSYQLNGSLRDCHVVFESSRDIAAVTAFYKSSLNSGNWRVIPSAGGEIRFRLINGKHTVLHGTLDVAASNDRTEVTIEVFS